MLPNKNFIKIETIGKQYGETFWLCGCDNVHGNPAQLSSQNITAAGRITERKTGKGRMAEQEKGEGRTFTE